MPISIILQTQHNFAHNSMTFVCVCVQGTLVLCRFFVFILHKKDDFMEWLCDAPNKNGRPGYLIGWYPLRWLGPHWENCKCDTTINSGVRFSDHYYCQVLGTEQPMVFSTLLRIHETFSVLRIFQPKASDNCWAKRLFSTQCTFHGLLCMQVAFSRDL